MKLPKCTPFFFALAAMPIYAAPFIVSDPYPASGPQPTDFVITVSGTTTPGVIPATAALDRNNARLPTTPGVIPATNTAQGAILKWDVAGVSGSKTITAKARNAWRESAASGPFTFTAGTPAAPSGIGLSAQ